MGAKIFIARKPPGFLQQVDELKKVYKTQQVF
jgi:hypothetical protein